VSVTNRKVSGGLHLTPIKDLLRECVMLKRATIWRAIVALNGGKYYRWRL